MATITVAKRKRGLFGWIIVAAFWLWQLFMGICLVSGLSSTSDQYIRSKDSFEQAGTTIGATIGIMFLLTVWALVSIILGLMLLFTRGKTVSITREVAG